MKIRSFIVIADQPAAKREKFKFAKTHKSFFEVKNTLLVIESKSEYREHNLNVQQTNRQYNLVNNALAYMVQDY